MKIKLDTKEIKVRKQTPSHAQKQVHVDQTKYNRKNSILNTEED